MKVVCEDGDRVEAAEGLQEGVEGEGQGQVILLLLFLFLLLLLLPPLEHCGNRDN